MGLHSYFQKKMMPLESVMSKVWNKQIFENIQIMEQEAMYHMNKEGKKK